jgi:maltokinase
VSFLDAYHLGLDRAGRADLLDERLIRPFQVQQECREYAYAARYLPHWRYVPDAALPALLSRGSS